MIALLSSSDLLIDFFKLEFYVCNHMTYLKTNSKIKLHLTEIQITVLELPKTILINILTTSTRVVRKQQLFARITDIKVTNVFPL